jgi:hypothetical protein
MKPMNTKSFKMDAYVVESHLVSAIVLHVQNCLSSFSKWTAYVVISCFDSNLIEMASFPPQCMSTSFGKSCSVKCLALFIVLMLLVVFLMSEWKQCLDVLLSLGSCYYRNRWMAIMYSKRLAKKNGLVRSETANIKNNCKKTVHSNHVLFDHF